MMLPEFVGAAEAAALLERVNADVLRLSAAINHRADPLASWVLQWKHWRNDWLAFYVAAKNDQLSLTFKAPAVMTETEAREVQLRQWYAEAAKHGIGVAVTPAPPRAEAPAWAWVLGGALVVGIGAWAVLR